MGELLERMLEKMTFDDDVCEDDRELIRASAREQLTDDDLRWQPGRMQSRFVKIEGKWFAELYTPVRWKTILPVRDKQE